MAALLRVCKGGTSLGVISVHGGGINSLTSAGWVVSFMAMATSLIYTRGALRRLAVVMLTVFATGTMLSAFLLPANVAGTSTGGAERRAEAEVSLLLTALECYQADFGTFPIGGDAVVCRELAGGPEGKTYCEWRGRVTDGYFLDPWGTPYQFRNEGDRVIVRSAGKDRVFANGGPGDDVVVSNW